MSCDVAGFCSVIHKPKSVIRPHITLSILCIDAFSQSFCFYWRLFVSFFLT